jgi:hypothetical protein
MLLLVDLIRAQDDDYNPYPLYRPYTSRPIMDQYYYGNIADYTNFYG